MQICQCGTNSYDAEQRESSRIIDKAIQAEKIRKKKEAERLVKILILGPGESGKSTVLKQMKLLYGSGFSPEEVARFKLAITSNIIKCAQSLVNAMDQLQIPYGFDPNASPFTLYSQESLDSIKAPKTPRTPKTPSIHFSMSELFISQKSKANLEGYIYKVDDDVSRSAALQYIANGKEKRQPEYARIISHMSLVETVLSHEGCVEAIKALWADTGVQYCFSRSNEYQLPDCCKYVLTNIDRLATEEYTPTEADILMARVMTTTVTETKFMLEKDTPCVVYDVGGQRSERKKWAPYFQDVSAIIFVIAISEYSNVLAEDSETNRMIESLSLFGSICNHPLFKSMPMIVFLNKIDLFREKITKIPISACFPSFQGPSTFESGCAYFKDRVNEINKYVERKLYINFTWGTDTNQMKKIFLTVQDILLRDSLSTMGMI